MTLPIGIINRFRWGHLIMNFPLPRLLNFQRKANGLQKKMIGSLRLLKNTMASSGGRSQMNLETERLFNDSIGGQKFLPLV
jgi:hypothetical protein